MPFHRRCMGLAAALMSLFSGLAPAQPNAAPPDRYGDRQAGNFGDPGQGYFGNPGTGNFARYRFPRDQEGSIAPSPAVPRRADGAAPAPEAGPSPYVVLPQPVPEQ